MLFDCGESLDCSAKADAADPDIAGLGVLPTLLYDNPPITC